MQTIDESRVKVSSRRSALALVLLAPALFWWSALAISLAALTGIADYLGSNLMQVLILVICPLSAVLISMSSPKGSRLRWTIAVAGKLLTVVAFRAT